MVRIVSLIVLVVILLVTAALFFKVMIDFLVPMFLALLLAVIFGPVNQWLFRKSQGHRWLFIKPQGYPRVAAGLTTVLILLIVLIPLLLVLLKAATESVALYHYLTTNPVVQAKTDNEAFKNGKAKVLVEKPLPEEEKQKPDQVDFQMSMKTIAGEIVNRASHLKKMTPDKKSEYTLRLENALHAGMNKVVSNLQETLMPLALSTPGYVGHFVLGAFVMIVSLYYFLADGPGMIRSVMRLSPLEDKYEEELVSQFVSLSRTLVIATLLSAFAQGLLAGAGFFFVGLGSVFLLTILAVLFAMIPFVGAAAVWVPVCLWLYLIDGRTTAAVVLALWCIVIVSMIDNIIKPALLHGRANLHPLLALLSVLGGVAALGPIGIFVGPMAVVFLQTLLNMVHNELEMLDKKPALADPQAAGGNVS